MTRLEVPDYGAELEYAHMADYLIIRWEWEKIQQVLGDGHGQGTAENRG